MFAFALVDCAKCCARYFFDTAVANSISMTKLTLETNSDEIESMLVGYARVSTVEQNLDLQIDALVKYGVDRDRIWFEKRSAVADGPVSAIGF